MWYDFLKRHYIRITPWVYIISKPYWNRKTHWLKNGWLVWGMMVERSSRCVCCRRRHCIPYMIKGIGGVFIFKLKENTHRLREKGKKSSLLWRCSGVKRLETIVLVIGQFSHKTNTHTYRHKTHTKHIYNLKSVYSLIRARDRRCF